MIQIKETIHRWCYRKSWQSKHRNSNIPGKCQINPNCVYIYIYIKPGKSDVVKFQENQENPHIIHIQVTVSL